MLDGPAPAWTVRFLTEHWNTIVKGSMPAWMPVELEGSTPRRRSFDSLGCGHYGCVFRTHTPGLVMKISSDQSEAIFVKAAVKLGDWPDGIVRYQAILDLPGSHRNRPVSIIWREEAYEIGVISSPQFEKNPRAAQEVQRYHSAYMNAARVVREMSTKPNWPKMLVEAKRFEEWAWNHVIWEDGERRTTSGTASGLAFMRYRGGQRLAAALRICAICFEMWENTDSRSEIGAALGFYLDHGILLADVHYNNMGKVTREVPGWGEQVYDVITDPGHAVFLP